MTSGKIADSDSHIAEPVDLWEKNLEPKYRSRALCLRRDEQGLEYLSVDGKKSTGYQGGQLASTMAGVGRSKEWVLERAHMSFAEGGTLAPGAVDPHERIRFLDSEGIDVTFIYPTLGLGWSWECEDPQLSAAYCRVYNDWLSDWCSPYPDRLIGIAHASVRDVNEGVVELKRVAKMGMKGAFIQPVSVNGIDYGDSYYDPFWAAAQELEMPITLHVAFNPNYLGRELFSDTDGMGPEFMSEMLNHGDFLVSLTNLMCEGVFERFPRLRMNMVEDGSGWITHWLDKMDIKYEMYSEDLPLKMKPSDYFKRQIWISIEPDETTAPYTARLVGADRLLWGSDWPHVEGHTEPVGKMKRNVASLPEEDQRKILGENALAMYGLK